MDRREHHRVQLRLPARLRWTTPLGQKTEVCTTADVSRGGMLVPCREPHAEGMPLWVTFPFDASLTVGQPEVFARVVRVSVMVRDEGATKRNGNGNGQGSGHHKNGNGDNGDGKNGNGAANGHKNGNGNSNGGAHHPTPGAGVFRSPSATEAAATELAQRILESRRLGRAETVAASHDSSVALANEFSTLLALRFEIPPRHQLASASAIVPLRDVERRATPRRPFVVPVRVRTEHVPWFEETMTIDCSRDGLRFRSNREYTRGEFLIVSFESAATSPWLGVTESLLMVVRVESEPEVAELQVAVCRTQQFAFRF